MRIIEFSMLYFVNGITIFHIFNFTSELLPALSQLRKMWEMLKLPISDFNLKCQTPSYLNLFFFMTTSYKFKKNSQGTNLLYTV